MNVERVELFLKRLVSVEDDAFELEIAESNFPESKKSKKGKALEESSLPSNLDTGKTSS